MTAQFRKQGGFTLVEALIAMLISSIMISVAVTQLTLSRRQFSYQEASSRIDENARYAMEILTEYIRMAGYASDDSVSIPLGQLFNGNCSNKFNPCTNDGAENLAPGDANDDDVDDRSDYLAVWYNPESDISCTGAAITADQAIANVFFVSDDNGFNSLKCQSYDIDTPSLGSTSNNDLQPIIEGIENMQILYGFTNGSDANPTRYISADTINAMPITGSPAPWGSISAVRIELLVGTGYDDKALDLNTRTYQLADSKPVSYTDRRLRKIYSTTVAINNANF